jgi:integrase
VGRFFEGLQLSPRSYNNFLRALKTFFAFAQKRGWLSREADLLRSVEKRKEKTAPVEIFSPPELSELLNHASAALRPCLALAAFAGLRMEEILRLEWVDVERRPGFIEVAAHKAKTATRRLVPIADNLAAWLATASHDGARVWTKSKAWFFESVREAVVLINEERGPKAASFVSKRNALRHSFISYRLADAQDINRVALEAGNSPQMIFRHYRELATPEQAATWFAINPKDAANIIAIGAKGAKY